MYILNYIDPYVAGMTDDCTFNYMWETIEVCPEHQTEVPCRAFNAQGQVRVCVRAQVLALALQR